MNKELEAANAIIQDLKRDNERFESKNERLRSQIEFFRIMKDCDKTEIQTLRDDLLKATKPGLFIREKTFQIKNPSETAAILAILFANHGTTPSMVASAFFFVIFIYREWKEWKDL